ncbi:MAG: sugar phosphate isomerase/epimerase family protein [Verrucomicrobiota bacterium]
MTRRKFLTSAAAASPLLMTQPVSLFAQNAKLARAATRRNLCAFEKPLQFLSFDELAELLAEIGFSGIEAAVRPGGHVLPEKVEEDLPRFIAALKKRGLEMTVLTSGINSVDSPHAEKVLRTAAKLGVKRYRMNWYRYDLEKPILPQIEAIRPKLKTLAALNRELGLTALYQNHAGDKMVGAPLWDIYSLIKDFAPKEIALAYDIRHATVEGGLSWPLQFNLVKSHIGAVFVKDFVWENAKVKNVPLGEGMVDKKFFPMLKEANFTGPISLHVEYLDHSREKKVLAEAFGKDFATLQDWLA